MKTCLASAMKVYLWGLSVCTKCTEPAVQELSWLKALLQCRFRDTWGCPELPGRIHRWWFFCGSSLAVYFADDGKGRKRKLQLHLSRFFKCLNIQSYVNRLTNWNNWMHCPLLCMDDAKLAQSIGRSLGTLQLWNIKILEIIWFPKGWWQMFWIKEMIAAFQARKGLQKNVWHAAFLSCQGIKTDRLRGTDVLCIWASLPSPVTPTLG